MNGHRTHNKMTGWSTVVHLGEFDADQAVKAIDQAIVLLGREWTRANQADDKDAKYEAVSHEVTLKDLREAILGHA